MRHFSQFISKKFTFSAISIHEKVNRVPAPHAAPANPANHAASKKEPPDFSPMFLREKSENRIGTENEGLTDIVSVGPSFVQLLICAKYTFSVSGFFLTPTHTGHPVSCVPARELTAARHSCPSLHFHHTFL